MPLQALSSPRMQHNPLKICRPRLSSEHKIVQANTCSTYTALHVLTIHLSHKHLVCCSSYLSGSVGACPGFAL